MTENICILIVDDDHRMAQTIVDILEVKGYEAHAVHSGPEALEMVEMLDFDCVLTDIKMPLMNGVELFRAIHEQRPEIPVVLMTAYATNQLVKNGLDEGAIAVVNKPLDITLLLGFFSSLSKELTIAIVDDDVNFCLTLGEILQTRGHNVLRVSDLDDLEKALEQDYQVVLLDMKLEGATGLEVLKQIREKKPHAAVILVTGHRAEMSASIEAALELTAYTCLYKPLQIEKLLQTVTDVHHQDLGRMLGQKVRKKN